MLNLNYMVKDLGEGFFVGISFGGVAFGEATEVATSFYKTIDSGKVVFILCDRGNRYLSMNYFGS